MRGEKLRGVSAHELASKMESLLVRTATAYMMFLSVRGQQELRRKKQHLD